MPNFQSTSCRSLDHHEPFRSLGVIFRGDVGYYN